VSWADTLRTGLDAIRSHRLRSGLTMLGILIGIAAVILTVGLGEGAQQQVSSAINALGTNLLVVSPGSSTTGGVRGGSGTSVSLTASDATALGDKSVAPDIQAVAPSNSRSESLTAGSEMPVTLDVTADPLPEPVELAAYFIVSESLTNAARYAGPCRVEVRIAPDDGALLVEIADDGCGGADAAAGTGLRGLADRIDALGGRLEIDSPAGAGTRLTARLPLAAAR